jgi:hypothetical protein
MGMKTTEDAEGAEEEGPREIQVKQTPPELIRR